MDKWSGKFEKLIYDNQDKVAVILKKMTLSGASNKAFIVGASFGFRQAEQTLSDIKLQLGLDSEEQVIALRSEALEAIRFHLSRWKDGDEVIPNQKEIAEIRSAFANANKRRASKVTCGSITLENNTASITFTIEKKEPVTLSLSFPITSWQVAFNLGKLEAMSAELSGEQNCCSFVFNGLATIFPYYFEED